MAIKINLDEAFKKDVQLQSKRRKQIKNVYYWTRKTFLSLYLFLLTKENFVIGLLRFEN